MEIKFPRAYWLPWVFVITIVTSVLTLYAWSVLLKDVPAFLPYVSDAGGHAPQSALFGLALLVCGFCAMTSFLIRYVSVKAVNSEKPRGVITLMNYVSLFNAGLTCLGMAMVGTNPVSHLRRDGSWRLPVLLPHLLGAGILFVNASSYFLIQTCFVWMLGHDKKRVYLGYARAASSLISLAGSIPLVVFAPYNDLEDLRPVPEHGTLYKGNSPWSAFGEWVMILGLLCNVLTLVPDLKRVRVSLHVENVEDLHEKDNTNEVHEVMKL
ncbi:DNA damage-regulated autophagy modulator protein 1-like [Ornithodoros turicata]|uniref:DNA damage-regulated autophagy modulator protein 1-like n=1 Tax=Ornithodoros turicata TaxID=34597 RepID=UPI0031390B13